MENEIICRCEEITKEEIERAILEGATTVNEIKRWTRAGMGLCQGRTCRRLVERMLAEKMNIPLAEVRPSTYRQPIRPIKMELLCNESKALE